MFGTVLWDVYRENEANDLHAAIEDIASAKDNYGWSSTGVYAFYDPTASAKGGIASPLQYLGLATDLPARFAQHNGIVRTRPGSSKKQNIRAWFEVHEILGYSAFVQSPLHQAHVARFKSEFKDTTVVDWTENFEYDRDSRNAITLLEGQLIQTSVTDRGILPPWNRIGGSRDGQMLAEGGSGTALLSLMVGSYDSLFVARRSIRELSSDVRACEYEFDLLHPARMQAILYAGDEGASNPDILSWLARRFPPGMPSEDWHAADSAKQMANSRYISSSTRK